MKNLKKVLALVLVVVMAFSLVTIGSAAFTDQKDIKYTTAVGVMTGIGAISGYPDGSFAPKGEVTRAEAAKMIAYAILGPTVAATLRTSTSSFTDVAATHWASPFIEYCVNEGIINGRGDGTFDPNGKVTGFEIAKMMLAAAGYGKNDEYVGANWTINVAKDAMQNDVFAGNEDANFQLAATREEAALYIYNGIWYVGQVEYNELFGYYAKGGSALTPASDGPSIASDVYSMLKVRGIVIGGSVTGTAKTGTNVALATVVDGKLTSVADSLTKFDFEATAADIGQLKVIYFNEDTDEVYYTETLSTTYTSIFGVTTAYSYVTAFGSSAFTAAKAVVKITNNYTDSAYSVDTSANNAAVLGVVVGESAPAGTYALYGGQIISLTSLPTKTFEKVDLVTKTTGTESIRFSTTGVLSNSASSDVVKEYEGIKAGDYVVLTKTGLLYTVGKTTTVDGKISKVANMFGAAWNGVFPPTITLDGKDYTASQATGAAGLPEVIPGTAAEYANNTYTLVLADDGTWLVCMLKTGTSANDVVYLTGKTWTATENYDNVTKVQAVNNAGEQVVYTSLSGLSTTNAALVGGFYKVGTTGTTIKTNTFELVSATTTGYGTTFIPAVTTAVTEGTIKVGTSYYFAADVNFIFVTGTGANLKITKVTGVAAVADNLTLNNTDLLYFNETTSPNKTVTTVIVSGAYAGAGAAKTLYLKNSFLLPFASPTGSDADGYTYTAYIDGVATTIKATNDMFAGDTFVTYTVDNKGIYTFTGINGAAGAPGVAGVYNDAVINQYGVFNGTITTATGDSWTVASDAKVLDFVTSAFDPAVYTSVAALEAETATKTFEISYVKNADDQITVIYVTDATDIT